MKKVMIAMLCLGLGSTYAQVDEDTDTFVQWDLDRDGYIMDDEYDEFWNENNFFSDWDSDGDGILIEDEWNTGVETYYGSSEYWNDNAYDNFDMWDSDSDKRLNEDEFREGNYNAWDFDRDGRIAEEEYANFYEL